TAKRDEAVALYTGAMADIYQKDIGLIQTMVGTNSEELESGRGDVAGLYSSTFLVTLIVGGLAMALAIAAAAFAFFSIGRPIARLTAAVRGLAGGDLAAEIPSLASRNEIGEMARAVVAFRESIVERAKLESTAEEERLKKDEQQRELETVL